MAFTLYLLAFNPAFEELQLCNAHLLFLTFPELPLIRPVLGISAWISNLNSLRTMRLSDQSTFARRITTFDAGVCHRCQY